MTFAIRHITPANTHLLDRVAADVFDEEMQPDRLAAFLADANHALFVAVEAGVVIGQIRGNVHLQPDRASDLYIDNLGTAPGHQRRGIASGMIRALIAWGRERGCTYVWVATETDNEGGIAFYESQRFERRLLEWFASEIDAT